MSVKKLSPFKRESEIHHKVLECVKGNLDGQSISQIVEKTKFSRKTVEKHLQLLDMENEIYMRQFGPSRVYYPAKKREGSTFRDIKQEGRSLVLSVIERDGKDSLLIQEKVKQDNEYVTKGSLVIPLKMSKDFMKTLGEFLSVEVLKEVDAKHKKKKKVK